MLTRLVGSFSFILSSFKSGLFNIESEFVILDLFISAFSRLPWKTYFPIKEKKVFKKLNYFCYCLPI